MKKIKYLALALVAFSAIQSCEGTLDIDQPGQIYNEEIFENVNDLERYLTGDVYTKVDITNQIALTSFFTDEVKIGPSNAGQNQELFRFGGLNPLEGYTGGIWASSYSLINSANRLMYEATKITPKTAAEQTSYNSILAEARVLRAYSYLNLMSFFTTDMKDNNALGVMLVPAFSTDPNVKLPRVKNSDIWQSIESDLAFADTNFTGNSTHKFPFFVSKPMIAAMRARMYLYRGNYTLAQQYAQSAITLSGLSLTAATPYLVTNPDGTPNFYNETNSTNPYRRMWSDVSPAECIFKIGRPVSGTGGNIANLYTTNSTASNGSPLWTMGLNLSAAITSNTNDIRNFAFKDPTTTGTTIIIDKYPGKGTTPLKNDLKVFRISEMYFILAECAAQSNDLAGAANHIRIVRNTRKTMGTVTVTYATKEAALRDILKERRVELCFEGHRYVDLRRLGAQAGVSIDRNPSDDFNATTPLTLPITDHRFTLPIPSVETSGNPSIQQNPGY